MANTREAARLLRLATGLDLRHTQTPEQFTDAVYSILHHREATGKPIRLSLNPADQSRITRLAKTLLPKMGLALPEDTDEQNFIDRLETAVRTYLTTKGLLDDEPMRQEQPLGPIRMSHQAGDVQPAAVSDSRAKQIADDQCRHAGITVE